MRRVAVAVALLVCVPRPAGAGPIDPFRFAPLGAFDSSGLPGTYTISGTTLTRPDGTTLAGVSYQDNPGHSLTVFDFSSFNLTAGSSIFAGGTAPLVLLAQSSMTIAGRISLPASSLFSFNSTPGSEATNAREGLGHIDSFTHTQENTGGGGGGFGGDGSAGVSTPITENGVLVGVHEGGAGGPSHGNLFSFLQGGSAGAPSPTGPAVFNGGGAVELGAGGNLTLTASGIVNVDGALGGTPGGGGGSGGGVFIHAASVSIRGQISALGGGGGPAEFFGRGYTTGGGSGGGGRVAIGAYESEPSLVGGTINVGNGVVSSLLLSPVPEPASFIMLSLGLAAVAGVAWRRASPDH